MLGDIYRDKVYMEIMVYIYDHVCVILSIILMKKMQTLPIFPE